MHLRFVQFICARKLFIFVHIQITYQLNNCSLCPRSWILYQYQFYLIRQYLALDMTYQQLVILQATVSLSLASGPISELAWSLQTYYKGHTPLSLTAGDAITCYQQQGTGKIRQWTVLPTLRRQGIKAQAVEGLKSLSI